VPEVFTGARYGEPRFAGAGVVGGIGRGVVKPEPVVLGGLRIGALLVVVDDGLPAVLFSLFQAEMTMNATRASTARPTIQPHTPLTLSPLCTGSLKRGSV
jgi:hypothetical protein